MRHRRGIDLVGTEPLLRPTAPEEPSEHTYRVEVWSDPPESGTACGNRKGNGMKIGRSMR
jgi:hypothetical protein